MERHSRNTLIIIIIIIIDTETESNFSVPPPPPTPLPQHTTTPAAFCSLSLAALCVELPGCAAHLQFFRTSGASLSLVYCEYLDVCHLVHRHLSL